MSLTITVISGLYQKIDPKVREARRKKFFGSGRRKRDTTEEDEGQMVGKENLEEDLLLEVFGSKDLEEGDQNTDASRKGRSDGSPQNSGSRFHAFHSCKKFHVCCLGCQSLSSFLSFHSCAPVGEKFSRDNAGLRGLAMKPQLDLRTERAICRGHLSDLGVHCYRRRVQRGLTVWSGGSTNAFIIIRISMTMSSFLQWLLFEGCTYTKEDDDNDIFRAALAGRPDVGFGKTGKTVETASQSSQGGKITTMMTMNTTMMTIDNDWVLRKRDEASEREQQRREFQ